MSVAWVYQELRAIRERAEARDVEEQIQAVEERLRRVIEARRAVSGAPQPSTVATGADRVRTRRFKLSRFWRVLGVRARSIRAKQIFQGRKRVPRVRVPRQSSTLACPPGCVL